ncbi:hypothetical protein EDD38_7689, partial [Kitasatospora cineracea]
MSALTPAIRQSAPASLVDLAADAEAQQWTVSVAFVAAGAEGQTADLWRVELDALTEAG